MTDQTIKPVLPVVKPRNRLQNKKVEEKNKQPAEGKATAKQEHNKKGGIDTYA
ncbi:MAG: hypothetical protein GY744_19630 [Gammaproteobacteria bacterium]|nr:hypothetical protein [Gammaproteobacteria bacterium]